MMGEGELRMVARMCLLKIENDAGIDITALMNKTTAIWQKMNEKK